VNYFAYGSNLSKKQMQARCPASKAVFTAVLPNYKLVFNGWSRQWRGGTASLRPLRGERVRGAIYEVTEDCLRRLDKFEAGYERLKVIVFNTDDEPVEAITYVRSGQVEDAKPSPDYVSIIQQGYRDWRLF